MRIRSARFSKISILKGRQTADKQSEFYLFICPPLFQCPRIVLFAPVVSVWTKPNTNFFQQTKLGLVKLFVLLSSSALFVYLNHFSSFCIVGIIFILFIFTFIFIQGHSALHVSIFFTIASGRPSPHVLGYFLIFLTMCS